MEWHGSLEYTRRLVIIMLFLFVIAEGNYERSANWLSFFSPCLGFKICLISLISLISCKFVHSRNYLQYIASIGIFINQNRCLILLCSPHLSLFFLSEKTSDFTSHMSRERQRLPINNQAGICPLKDEPKSLKENDWSNLKWLTDT
jgi:hypothetical protein